MSKVKAAHARSRVWPLGGLLILLGFLPYANSLSVPFLFDDIRAIAENEQIRRLWPLSVPLSPPDETPMARRPLVNLSFAVNYALGGLNVRGYHLLNIGIHLLCGLVLFGIVRRHVNGRLAWWCALIWLLHPLQTDAVTYTTQRTELAMGLFYLLTLYCAIVAVDSAHRSRWHVASFAACALGMACKESMVTAPLMVAVYDRIFVFGSWKDALRSRTPLYAGLASTWIVLAALISSGHRTSVELFDARQAWNYLLNQLPLITRYVGLVFWPRSLVLDYGVPRPLAPGEIAGQAMLVLGLAIAAVAALRVRPRLGFLGLWFFVTLAPTSSVIAIATEVGAERRMYLPLAAIVVLVVVGAQRLLSAATHALGMGGRIGTAALSTALATVAALLAFTTIGRNREFSSALQLAQTTVDRYPHGRAYFFLGTELMDAGREEEGMEYLTRSAADFPGARFAIGVHHLEGQRLDEGIDQLETFIRLAPTHINVPYARDLLGRAYLQQGKLDSAAHQYTERLKLAPIDFEALERLGEIASRQGKLSESIAHYQAFLAQRPNSPVALNRLGVALAASGRLPDAIQAFQRAAAMDPRDFEAWLNLARAHLEARDGRKAVDAARQAVTLRPDDADAYEVLADALAVAGSLDEAVAALRSASRLSPGDERLRQRLAQAERFAQTPR